MAEITPFRGIRYDTSAVSPDEVTSPPYDVISPADRDGLHERHPKNVVRLILGQELPEDDHANNRYTRASAHLKQWIADGTLVRDPEPAYYAYEQNYVLRGRTRTVRGFVGLVKLHDYEDKVVFPHEYTLSRPKSHLAPLIRATGANLDSVYGLYPDPERVVDAVLDRVTRTAPLAKVTDNQEVSHKLWIVIDRNDIDTITSALAGREIVIADGHHRYETSLAYRDELRARDCNPAEDMPYDYVMMTLVNIYSPDVVVLPTHRMVLGLPDDLVDVTESKLSEAFDLLPSSKEALMSDMEDYGGRAIGVYRAGRAYVAVAKQSDPASSPVENLDVWVLHKRILDDVFGIDAEKLRLGANVAYTRDEREAICAVDCAEFQIAFFLNPIRLEPMLDVARAGERMPQKATYFYPKLLSGLVMRKVEW